MRTLAFLLALIFFAAYDEEKPEPDSKIFAAADMYQVSSVADKIYEPKALMDNASREMVHSRSEQIVRV